MEPAWVDVENAKTKHEVLENEDVWKRKVKSRCVWRQIGDEHTPNQELVQKKNAVLDLENAKTKHEVVENEDVWKRKVKPRCVCLR